MNLFKKLGITAVGVVLGLSATQGQANATSLNMITNGEFEDTRANLRYDQGYGRFDYASPQLYSGWEVDDAYARHSWLKQQGYNQIETTGSDGLATGNFFAGHSAKQGEYANISQTFTLGENIDTNALFSFDYANFNTSQNSIFRVIVSGSESKSLLDKVISVTNNSWTQYERELNVIAGEEITVNYYSSGTNAIDDISFLVNEKSFKAVKRKVPEPTSILGLIGVSAVVGSSLKRKRKSSNIELV